MATKIRDRVPVFVAGSAQELQAGTARELTGCRFMGVLMHPVPWTDMQSRFGVTRPGCRMVVRWQTASPEDHPVKAGDLLQIGDSTHEVCGVVERPGCYLELFFAE